MICPDEKDIERLLTAPERPATLDGLREHARTCALCARTLERCAEGVLARSIAGEDAHLDSIALSRYLDEGSAALESMVTRHVAHCARCSERLAAMRAGRQEATARPVELFAPHTIAPERSARRPLPTALRWAAAAGVILALFIAYSSWRATTSDVHDGSLVIRVVDGEVRIRGASQVEESLIREKIGKGGAPRSLAALPPVPRTLGDSAEPSALIVIHRPLPDEGLLGPSIRIAWDRIPGAGTYTVRIYRNANMDTPALEKVTPTDFADIQLGRGEHYVVTVTAQLPDPAAKRYSPPIAFRSLSDAEADAVRRTVAKLGDSHLLKGIVYEKHHMLSAALDEYRQLAEANRRSPTAQKIFETYRVTITGK